MRKIAYLVLASAFMSAPAFAADNSIPEQKQEVSEFTKEIDYFSYTSDVCNSIKDERQLFEIAMELRDSSDVKKQISSVDCLIGSAIRAYGPAEYELARMYSVGSIVAQSDMFAYRWAQIAVMDGYKPAVNLRDSLEKKLKVEELETAFNDAKRIYEERQKSEQINSNKTISNNQSYGNYNRSSVSGSNYNSANNYRNTTTYKKPATTYKKPSSSYKAPTTSRRTTNNTNYKQVAVARNVPSNKYVGRSATNYKTNDNYKNTGVVKKTTASASPAVTKYDYDKIGMHNTTSGTATPNVAYKVNNDADCVSGNCSTTNKK